jgi:serine protease
MATPHASAVAALIISQAGGYINPDQVYERITSTALDIGTVGIDSQTAYGLVQAKDALNFTPCVDNDRDGYCADAGDCDDRDPLVNSGAAEICDDKVDNNCSGVSDELCESPACTEKKGACTTGADCCSGGCHPIKSICL